MAGELFRPLSRLTARWCRLDGHGMEHLTLERHGKRITATGVVTAATPDLTCGAWYQIFLDEGWRPRAVSVHLTDSRWFVANSPEPGRWCDGDGRALDQFAGCRDVALPQSAFWCTPVLRRLLSTTTERKTARVLAIDFAEAIPNPMTMQMDIDRDRRCLTVAAEALDNIKASLEFDRDGLVEHFPGRFRRLA